MNSTFWRQWFERNAMRPFPKLEDPGLPAEIRDRLASTLARLQAGETGEGRIAHEVRKAGLGDADYHRAIELFVREEGRHAKILGLAVRALGGRPIPTAWAAQSFKAVRGVFGPRTKLLVLLAAEVIAIALYRSLQSSMPNGSLADVLREIGDDEEAHLAFHCDFFRTQTNTRPRLWLFRLAWAPCAAVCCAVVLLDHGATLRTLGTKRSRVAGEMLTWIRRVDETVAYGRSWGVGLRAAAPIAGVE